MENKTKKIQAGVFAAFLLFIAALPVTATDYEKYSPDVMGELTAEKHVVQPHYNYDYEILWREDFHLAQYSGGLRNAVDSQNNIITSGVDAYQQCVLMKLDTNGNIIWDNSVIPESDSIDLTEYVVMPLGGAPDEPETTYDMVERILPLLERSSDAEYIPMDVSIDSNDNIITSGVFFTDELTGGIAVLTKFDTNGNMLWNRSYNFLPPSDENYSWTTGVDVDSNNNIFLPIMVICDNSTTPFVCSVLLKISPNGNVLWLAPRLTAIYTDVAVDSNDNPVTCGTFYVSLPDPCSMVFTKFGKYTGLRQKETIVPIENNDVALPASIKRDIDGTLYSGGMAALTSGDERGIVASVDDNLDIKNVFLFSEISMNLIADIAIHGNDIVCVGFGNFGNNYGAMVIGKNNGAVKLMMNLGSRLGGGFWGIDDYTKGVSIDQNGDAIVGGGRGGIVTIKVDIIASSWIPPLLLTDIQMQQQYQCQ